VVDSSCWIEYLMGSAIGTAVSPIVEAPASLVVPAITLFEVYKKLAREKEESYAASVIQYMRTGNVIGLDADLSVFAAILSQQHNLPMADSIIYATSIRHDAVLWTCDRHFEAVPGIEYLPKSTA